MSKKTNRILMLITFLMIICFSNISSVNAYELSWHAGDVFGYTVGTNIYSKVTDDLTGYYEEAEMNIQDEVTFNITGINLLSKVVNYIYTSSMGPMSTGNDFGWNDFTSDLQIDDLFNPIYEWDYGTNSTILVDYSPSFALYYFLEPEWKLINDYFKEELNGSTIIETVNDPYNPIIYNITLNDFLNNITAFTLNGKGSLADGLNQLTATNTKWIMEINCNNELYDDNYNGTLGYDEYIPYTQ
ncbi:MAG: hypothetical protein FK733_14750, partial [Asgard group archaeon]|nr:hypothetical protein [Asgard group archaeon]